MSANVRRSLAVVIGPRFGLPQVQMAGGLLKLNHPEHSKAACCSAKRLGDRCGRGRPVVLLVGCHASGMLGRESCRPGSGNLGQSAPVAPDSRGRKEVQNVALSDSQTTAHNFLV
jgi:hypothetical protein